MSRDRGHMEDWECELHDDCIEVAAEAIAIDGAANDRAGYRTTIVHGMKVPEGEWTIYGISEEPRMQWLTVVCKKLGEKPVKIVFGDRAPLEALREAVERVLAGFGAESKAERNKQKEIETEHANAE